jgi:hypothetical protein
MGPCYKIQYVNTGGSCATFVAQGVTSITATPGGIAGHAPIYEVTDRTITGTDGVAVIFRAGRDNLVFTSDPTLPSGEITYTVAGTTITGKVGAKVGGIKEDNFTPVTGSNSVTLTSTPLTNHPMQVFRNGVLQRAGATNDFVLSGSTLTFADVFTSSFGGSIIEIVTVLYSY